MRGCHTDRGPGLDLPLLWVDRPLARENRQPAWLLARASLPRVRPQRADDRRLPARSPSAALSRGVGRGWIGRHCRRYRVPLWLRQPSPFHAPVSPALRNAPARGAPFRPATHGRLNTLLAQRSDPPIGVSQSPAIVGGPNGTQALVI